jgi:hypothetical protein
MKSEKSVLFAVIIALLSVDSAHAAELDLTCSEVETPQAYELSIHHAIDQTATVGVKGPQGLVTLQGTYQLSKNSIFGNVFEYTLVESTGLKSKLEVSHHHPFIGRGGCGRGGCHSDTTFISAELTMPTAQLSFTCYETATQ